MAYRQKSHKGVRKRLKMTATGKIRYKRSCAGHLMSGKSGKRRRKMRKLVCLSGVDAHRIAMVMNR